MATVISLDDVTNINKTGSFDLIITVLGSHLQAERQAGRITGQEYTNAYVQMMTAALQQSFSFELQKAQAQYQADLIAAQVVQTNAETGRINAATQLLGEQITNAELEGAQITAQTSLIASQKLSTDQERLNLIENGKQTLAQTELLKSQKLIADIEKDKVSKEILQLIAQTSLTTKQLEIVAEEKLKIIEETKLAAKQILVSDAQIASQLKQNLRTDEEIKFTQAKTKTEVANIFDTVDGATVAGVIGKQKLLLDAQTNGFKRNAEQGVLKTFAEIWSVLRSTDPDAVAPNDFGFSPANSLAVVNKAKEGIGLT